VAGIKLETFICDVFPLSAKMALLEVDRAGERTIHYMYMYMYPPIRFAIITCACYIIAPPTNSQILLPCPPTHISLFPVVPQTSLPRSRTRPVELGTHLRRPVPCYPTRRSGGSSQPGGNF
jgi:hypothetical protein